MLCGGFEDQNGCDGHESKCGILELRWNAKETMPSADLPKRKRQRMLAAPLRWRQTLMDI